MRANRAEVAEMSLDEIEDCLTRLTRAVAANDTALNAWEREFIVSVNKQYDSFVARGFTRPLTVKQLDRLWTLARKLADASAIDLRRIDL